MNSDDLIVPNPSVHDANFNYAPMSGNGLTYAAYDTTVNRSDVTMKGRPFIVFISGEPSSKWIDSYSLVSMAANAKQ